MSQTATILAPVPPAGRVLTLSLAPGADPRRVLAWLGEHAPAEGDVIGLGLPLLAGAGKSIAGLRAFPELVGPGVACPSTQGAIWASFGGTDPGALLHRARALVAALGDDVVVVEEVATFTYGGGRDLSGYEDGTENPKGERAREVAIIAGEGADRDGGSFVAVQRWVHDLGRLEAMSPSDRDAVVGRAREGNEELGDAPPSAHVKRSAQETFEPPAFMLRRSMPYGGVGEHGLYFVAYGRTLDPFERVLRRMVGEEDGVVDALFRFSRPVTGGYYFCGP